MAKQVNFYMTEQDELAFLEFIKSDRKIGIFAQTHSKEEITLLKNLPRPDETGWFSLWLWDMTNSPHPVLRFVPEQKHFVVDRFASEVIGLSRSYFDEERLIRGRIWAEITGWKMDDPSVTFKKSDAFTKWFKRLAGWLKRKGRKNIAGDYVLPGAQKHVNNGGRLSQAAYGKTVKIVRHQEK